MPTLTINNVDLKRLDGQRLCLVNHLAKHPNVGAQGILNMLDDWSDQLFTASEVLTTAGIEHDQYKLRITWFRDMCRICEGEKVLLVLQPEDVPRMLKEGRAR